ncbi:TPA: hypothetical protein ACJXLV_004023 [Salmonella enterica subsp. enterica serovar Give]|nr:hypothetical protein [Salmonella enterica subsp. enterica serovar Give]EHO2418563.1 hypothetical protein [Salmonella enterica]ECN9934100.1 hypothetical protein [Salmonella enterica subsp. enterica serovar Give]EEJ6396889.1 hypothetical protein [Salmonella enterica subsp. enterica serovar Give]EGP2183479.1 hypothetical protein [Salmonella enterica subsp. enterica serovar Give]
MSEFTNPFVNDAMCAQEILVELIRQGHLKTAKECADAFNELHKRYRDVKSGANLRNIKE